MKFDVNGEEINVGMGKPILIGLGVLIVITALLSVYMIGPGERGVLLTWGNPSMSAIGPGIHAKVPYMQTIETMNVQTNKYTASASSASKDLQEVTTQVTVNYHIDPNKVPVIYQNIGVGYEDKIIQPAVQEVVKAVTANFDASELVTRRSDVKTRVDSGIASRLSQYNMVVESNGVSITDFKFSEDFSKAIEDKVVAVQKKQKAENDLARIQIEAKQKMAQAEADKMYATTEMIALKQIEVNKAFIDKWNGQLPQYIMGEGSNGLVQMLPIGKATA